MTVDCSVMSRFAHTIMTSKALNRANSSQEISFDVELPKTAFIVNFSMSVCHVCNIFFCGSFPMFSSVSCLIFFPHENINLMLFSIFTGKLTAGFMSGQ